MHFTAADDDAITEPFLDMYISVRVRLLGRSQHSIAFNICLRRTSHQILALEAGEPLLEVFVVPGGAFVQLVCFVGYVIDGVGGIDAHASLYATADLLAQHAGHVLLGVKVSGAHMDVGEPIDSLASEMRDSRAQILIFRFGGFRAGADVAFVEVPILRML